MRASFFATLCLAMTVCIMAEDFILGERVEGDYIVSNRTIFKPPIPWKIMKATIGITCNSTEVLTEISCSNMGSNEATFTLVKGGPGTTNVVVLAVGKVGEGLQVKVEGYAISILTTTPSPTTTSERVETTTEAKPTSEVWIEPEPTSEAGIEPKPEPTSEAGTEPEPEG